MIALAVVEAVDEVKIAGPAAAGADREVAVAVASAPAAKAAASSCRTWRKSIRRPSPAPRSARSGCRRSPPDPFDAGLGEGLDHQLGDRGHRILRRGCGSSVDRARTTPSRDRSLRKRRCSHAFRTRRPTRCRPCADACFPFVLMPSTGHRSRRGAHGQEQRPPSSARTAVRCSPAGRASAKLAANGTRSSRRATPTGSAAGPLRSKRKGRPAALMPLSGETEEAPRIVSGIAELDRVTGGGFVRGSALLVGGDPGIGKSTLLMQAAAALARGGHKVIYVSGEEAVAQVRLRAQRLKAPTPASSSWPRPTSRTSRDARAGQAPRSRDHRLDPDGLDRHGGIGPRNRDAGARGSQALIRYAKSSGAAVILVGHVTKEGQIAGPPRRRAHGGRRSLLRGRRGPSLPHPAHRQEPLRTDRRDRRLRDERHRPARGPEPVRTLPRRAKRAGAGRRRLRRHGRHTPGARRDPGARRTLDARHAPPLGPRLGPARLAMVLAVLEGACGVASGSRRVYLNVAGGYRIQEPAADLAVAAGARLVAVGQPLPTDCVYFGEISLSGPCVRSPMRDSVCWKRRSSGSASRSSPRRAPIFLGTGRSRRTRSRACRTSWHGVVDASFNRRLDFPLSSQCKTRGNGRRACRRWKPDRKTN